MKKDSRIFVAGHRGLVGSALARRLLADGYVNVITKSRTELDLTNPAAVQTFFDRERPEYVFLAAGRVGGIRANDNYPAEFIHSNLAIATSVIHAAYLFGVRRLLFFGSTCTYPREAPQPMREEYFLAGPLEPTSEAYAVAKIAGVEMCRAYNRQYGTCFVPMIPATLYGPGDNVDPESAHVLLALIRRLHDARRAGRDAVEIWGTGRARREFLYVDDLVDACLILMSVDEAVVGEVLGAAPAINVGPGWDISIMDLALRIKRTVGFEGHLVTDPSRPDGAPQKLLDSSRMRALGWAPRTSLEAGIGLTYAWYRSLPGVAA